MAEKKDQEKMKSKPKSGPMKDIKKVARDLKQGKMPRIFKKKKAVGETGIAKTLTGRGGDPKSKGVKATSPVQKVAKKAAKKMTGKTQPEEKQKKKMGGK